MIFVGFLLTNSLGNEWNCHPDIVHHLEHNPWDRPTMVDAVAVELREKIQKDLWPQWINRLEVKNFTSPKIKDQKFKLAVQEMTKHLGLSYLQYNNVSPIHVDIRPTGWNQYNKVEKLEIDFYFQLGYNVISVGPIQYNNFNGMPYYAVDFNTEDPVEKVTIVLTGREGIYPE